MTLNTPNSNNPLIYFSPRKIWTSRKNLRKKKKIFIIKLLSNSQMKKKRIFAYFSRMRNRKKILKHGIGKPGKFPIWT
jgi:hypothetical protein